MVTGEIISLVDTLDKKYLHLLKLDEVYSDPEKPKKNLAIDATLKLADEIKNKGQLLPIVCVGKTDPQGNLKNYVFLGEAYFRALKLAVLENVYVVFVDELPVELIHLIFITYKNLGLINMLEEVELLNYLNKERGLNHNQLATRFNLTRSVITNKIRLLKLPVEVLYGLINKEISEGHARALLSLKNRELILNAYEIIKRDKMNVRQTEELVRRRGLTHEKRSSYETVQI